jgi:hypothetical protein
MTADELRAALRGALAFAEVLLEREERADVPRLHVVAELAERVRRRELACGVLLSIRRVDLVVAGLLRAAARGEATLCPCGVTFFTPADAPPERSGRWYCAACKAAGGPPPLLEHVTLEDGPCAS